MTVRRKIYCDIPGCDENFIESEPGAGFPNWGQLGGISLNSIPNPYLCPKHLATTADFVDSLNKAKA
jgi:hypothetical protein